MAGKERLTKLKIDGVKKVYNTRNGDVVALNGVDLEIKENEFICVVGPSGCGKSTLLNIIAGLEMPTEGAVYIDNKKIEGTGVERGVVFQQYALFPWMTVLKNVMFGPRLQGKSKEEAEAIAMKYIKMVQLEDFVNHYPKELSGGNRELRLQELMQSIRKCFLWMSLSVRWMPRQEHSFSQSFLKHGKKSRRHVSLLHMTLRKQLFLHRRLLS